jgi:hypothetical protein
MIIYLDDYKAAKPAAAAWLKNGTYGDEIMDAGWNPAVLLALPERSTVESPDLPHSMANVDVDAFLARVYGVASLI